MNEAVRALAHELESDDPGERSRAALFAGNYGTDANQLLPRLLEMICRNPVIDSSVTSMGEYVSVGRILRAIEDSKKTEHATDNMLRLSHHCISTVLTHLETATGARASLLIHTLALTGPRAAHTASIVSRVAARSSDPRIRYRAYQFACSVCPELASTPPWSDFAPANAEDKVKWEVL